MNILLKEKINNSIAMRGSEIINTKHLIENMNYIEASLSIETLELYLIDKGYISISTNYMMKLNEFVNYCTKNKINSISKLQRKLFVEYGIPFITLDDFQLLKLIGKENKKTINKNHEYHMEGIDEKFIMIREDEKEIRISNMEELINFGIDNTFITYDLIDEFCKIYPSKRHLEVKYVINDRDIRITSNSIKFDVIQSLDTELINTKTSYNSNIIINNDIDLKNNIIINLRLSELIATFINLSYEDGTISRNSAKNNYMNKHLSEFTKMGLLIKGKGKNNSYTITDECMVISKKLRSEIYIAPDRNLFMNKVIMTDNNLKYLCGVIEDEFKAVLYKFDNFKFILNMIKDLTKYKNPNMINIIEYCIANNYEKEYISFFLGKKGTSGKIALESGKDICYRGLETNGVTENSCNDCYSYHNINKENKINDLIRIRDNVSSEKYQKIISDPSKLKILIEDPLVVKFLVRFGVTFYNKSILKGFRIIDSDIYMKSHGQYCPYIDEWRMNNEI